MTKKYYLIIVSLVLLVGFLLLIFKNFTTYVDSDLPLDKKSGFSKVLNKEIPSEFQIEDFDERCTLIQRNTYLSCKVIIVFKPLSIRKQTVQETRDYIENLLTSSGIEKNNIQILFDEVDAVPQALITVAFGQEISTGNLLKSSLSEYVVSYKLVEMPSLGE